MDTSGTGAIAPRGGRRNEGIAHTSNKVSAPVGDFTKPTGYLAGGHDDRNQCYCHGDSHDPPAPLITHRDRLSETDYGYLLGDHALTVLLPSHGSLWAVAEVDWAAAPDWDDLSARLRHGTSHFLRLP